MVPRNSTRIDGINERLRSLCASQKLLRLHNVRRKTAIESHHQQASFPSLRLRLDYQQDYGFSVTKQISYLFLTECYGVVTRVRSQSGETSADFTKATEYRRMAAP